MHLLILAGGFGTRIRETIGGLPKILAPIYDTTFLKLQLDNWERQGFKNFLFLLHHQSSLIISSIKNYQNQNFRDCKIEYIIENEPLDTGGAVINAVKKKNLEEFTLINADTWIDNELIKVRNSSHNSIGVIERNNDERYGAILYDKRTGIIKSFVEKKSGKIGRSYINAGVFKFYGKIFKDYEIKKISLEKEIIPKLVNKKLLKAVHLNTNFIDIGVPEDYIEFIKFYKKRNYNGN